MAHKFALDLAVTSLSNIYFALFHSYSLHQFFWFLH